MDRRVNAWNGPGLQCSKSFLGWRTEALLAFGLLDAELHRRTLIHIFEFDCTPMVPIRIYRLSVDAWSEWSAGHETDGKAFIGDIWREIRDVEQRLMHVRVRLWECVFTDGGLVDIVRVHGRKFARQWKSRAREEVE